MVLITGPPGIGKTTLAARLRAAHHGPVLTARAAPWEREHAGGVLTQLLRSHAPAAGTRGLFVVDDADHADPESLRALSTLVRYHPHAPLLTVLLATRVTVELASLGAEHRDLEGLDAASTGQLAAARGLALNPAAARALARHADGNPRDILALLTEVPRENWSRADLALPAPSLVITEVRAGLEQAPVPARRLIEALAIFGTPSPLADAAQLAGLDDPLTAQDAATATGLITADPGRILRFTRRLTAQAVLHITGAQNEALLRRRAARLLRDDPARRLDQLAAASPGPDPALAGEADEQARRESGTGAWAAAARLWSASARLTTDPAARQERLIRSVDSLIAAGDIHEAAVLLPAVEGFEETALRDAVLAYLAVIRGRRDEAEIRLRRAGDVADTERDPQTAGMIAQRQVLHALACCRGEALASWADRAIELAGPGSPAGLEAAAIRGLGIAAAGQPDTAVRAYADLAARVPHGAQAQRVAMGRGWLELTRDDIHAARAHLEEALHTGDTGGSARIALWAHGWLARVQALTGEWDDALATTRTGLTLAEDSGITLTTPLLQWTAAQIHVLRGQLDKAGNAIRAAERHTRGYEIMRVPCRIARAQVAEARADYAAVLRALEPLLTPPADTSIDTPGFWPWPDMYANALVLEGRLAEAEAFLAEREKTAAGHRSATARLGLARGRLLGAQGDIAAAVQIFERSLELLEPTPLRYDTARVTFAYGQTLRRAGKRRDADAVITTARDMYLALGAATYVQRCDRELKASGLKTGGRRAPDELTPQEQSVAGLVAQGLSNREVATQLFLSTKTVQYHLTRIYAKLGVRTRTELASRHPR